MYVSGWKEYLSWQYWFPVFLTGRCRVHFMKWWQHLSPVWKPACTARRGGDAGAQRCFLHLKGELTQKQFKRLFIDLAFPETRQGNCVFTKACPRQVSRGWGGGRFRRVRSKLNSSCCLWDIFLGASPDWNDADLRDPLFLKFHSVPQCGAPRGRSAPEVWWGPRLTSDWAHVCRLTAGIFIRLLDQVLSRISAWHSLCVCVCARACLCVCVSVCLWDLIVHLCATVRGYMRLIPCSRIVGLLGLENKLTLLTLINLKPLLLSPSSTQREGKLRRLLFQARILAMELTSTYCMWTSHFWLSIPQYRAKLFCFIQIL